MSDSPRLYHVTAHRPDVITDSAICVFTSNVESLVLARGQWLEVMQIDESSDSLKLKCRFNCSAIIRKIECLKHIDQKPDQLVVSAQSSLVILQYDPDLNTFSSKYKYTNPQTTQLRSSVCGEYLSIDPLGRTIVSAALAQTKHVYIANDEDTGFDDPIETNSTNLYVYSMVSTEIDSAESPGFATFERVKYGEKQLSLYDINVGLSHTSRVWSKRIPENSLGLLAVKSGLMVFNDDGSVMHYSLEKDHDPYTSNVFGETFPVFTKLVKTGDDQFVFIQTRNSECFRLKFSDNKFQLSKVQAELPVELQVLEVFTSGFVFAAGANGDHQLFEVSELTDSDMVLEASTSYPSLSPLITANVGKQRELIAGTDNCSIAQVFMGGNIVEQLASSPLPSQPTDVFTVKRRVTDTIDKYIVLSFENTNTTTVLSVGEDGSVEEASEAVTGIASSISTLNIQGMAGGIVQVHSKGLRYITDSPVKVTPWVLPGRNVSVVASSVSKSQVVLALNDKSVVYFEERNGMLLESQKRFNMPSQITAISFGHSYPSRIVVGLEDETVREWSTDTFKQTRLYNLQFPITCVISADTNEMFVGHANGTVSQLRDDEIMVRVLGSKPVKLAKVNGLGVIALTTNAWILTKYKAVPLKDCQNITACSSFTTEDISNGGLVGIKGSSLEVLTITDDEIGSGIQITKGPEGGHTVGLFRIHNKYILSFQRQKVIVTDLKTNSKISEYSFVGNKIHAFSMVKFSSQKEECIVVALDRKITVLRFDNQNLKEVHETIIDGECTALLALKGKLIAAIRNRLVLFELGQKQLLFQDAYDLPDLTIIKCLKTMKDFIYVGDARRSVTVVKFTNDTFSLIASDPINRSVSCMIVLDLVTVAIGDHYGNIAIVRLSNAESLSASHSQEPNDALRQFELIAQFWIPDAITSLQKGMLSPVAGSEAIVYTGLQGTIGILIPFVSMTDYESFSEIEETLEECEPLIFNEDVNSFRGYYTPRRNVIDGDFCEQHLLNGTVSDESLEQLQSSKAELQFKLMSIRARSSV